MYRIGRRNLRRLHPLRTRTRAGTRIRWAIPSIRWAIPGRPESCDTSSDFSFSDVTYEIVEQCSKRGRPKLIDTQGYTYNQHRQRGIVTDWQCTVRPKMNPCRATVRQRGRDDFQTGSNLHNHQPQVGASTKLHEWPRDLSVHKKSHGRTVPSGNRDSGNICTATGKRVYSEATAVYGIRRNHLDQQHHMASIINIITVVNKK